MNYDARVERVRLLVTTTGRRKERDGEVRFTLRSAAGWEVNGGWNGPGEWVGKDVRWYKDEPAAAWENGLGGRRPSVRELVRGQGTLKVEFRNTDDDEDTWQFRVAVRAVLDDGTDIELMAEEGGEVGRRLRHGHDVTYMFTLSPPPAPPRPITRAHELIRAGDCSGAETVGRTETDAFALGLTLFNTAVCFAEHNDPVNAARVAGDSYRVTPEQTSIDGGVKISAKHLELEQKSAALAKLGNWRNVRFAVTIDQPARDILNTLVEALGAAWEQAIGQKLRGQGVFGPVRLASRAHTLEFIHQPYKPGILANYTSMNVAFRWEAYDLIKRFRKDDEYSNGIVTGMSRVHFSVGEKRLDVDVCVTTVGDLKIQPDSPNPEFTFMEFVKALSFMNLMAVTPHVHVATQTFEGRIKAALPWLPKDPDWTFLSIEVRPDDCIVGVAVDLPP